MILKTDRTLWGCGYNVYGCLGDGTTTRRITPVKIMDNVSLVSTGREHTIIRKTDGELLACGNNENGQLGDGTTQWRSTPVKVLLPMPKLQLSASPSGGQISAGTTVTLTAKADNNIISGCDIYFTTDGTTPTMSSTKYTSSGITIFSDCTLKAIAYKQEYETSDELTETYKIITLITSITLNKSSLSLETGKSETLTATVKPDNATDKSVTWTSSSTSVATVDSNGKVTANAKGTATITCKANDNSGVSATCEVTVTEPGPGHEPGVYTDIAQFANIVYLEEVTASTESTITVPVKMKNAQANIIGFQFDLILPSGVTVAKDEDGFYLIELSTDRTTARKHTVSAQQQSDGSIRVVCYSNNNSTFSGTSGNVLEVTLQVAADAPTGEQSIKLRDVVMTTPSLDSYNVPWVVSRLTVEDYILGDVNGDKLVNVVDVAGVVNLILNSGNTSQLNRKAADVNGDGSINVVDVAGVVNIILGNGASTRANAPTRADDQPLLYFDAYPIAQGQTITLPILLESRGDSFTGCQFDLYLPTGLSVADEDGYPLVEIGSGTTARKHVVSTTYQPDGALRVVCYSNNNSMFSGNEILTIDIQADDNAPLGNALVALKNITLSRPDVTGVTLRDFDNELLVMGDDGIDDIVSAYKGNAPVFSLSGQRLTAPRRGVNIVGGRKVVVK